MRPACSRLSKGLTPMIPIRASSARRAIRGRRFGVPRRDQLCFFGDDEYARLFDQAMMRVASLDGVLVEVDLSPFLDAARLLYEGPWVAERYAAIEDFITLRGEAMHPVTRRIIEAGKSFSAVDAFKGQYRLRALKRASERIWDEVDVLLDTDGRHDLRNCASRCRSRSPKCHAGLLHQFHEPPGSGRRRDTRRFSQ